MRTADLRRAIRLAVALLAMAAGQGTAQMPPVGAVEFYGDLRVPRDSLLRVLGIAPGDSITPAIRQSVRKLETIPGINRARVEAVCCEGGRTILYIGLESGTGPMVQFRPEPAGAAQLPGAVSSAAASFDTAFHAAVQAGEFGEDDTQGHSLMHHPAARASQEAFVALADRYGAELRAVLRESGDPAHRAIAAQVLAYATDKRAVVPELVVATRDPAPGVRNNAVRALAVLAGYASRHPQLAISVPADPLVDLLNSPVWTDRNKASLALLPLTDDRNSSLLTLIRERALESVRQMACWESPGHAMAGFLIAGRVQGMADPEIFKAWQEGRRKAVVRCPGS